jgi:hypothetical protein
MRGQQDTEEHWIQADISYSLMHVTNVRHQSNVDLQWREPKRKMWGVLARPFVVAGVECYGKLPAGGARSSQWEAAAMPGKVQ